MSNEDSWVINEKCKCQNENVIKCIENESEMKPSKCKNEKIGICEPTKQGLVKYLIKDQILVFEMHFAHLEKEVERKC